MRQKSKLLSINRMISYGMSTNHIDTQIHILHCTNICIYVFLYVLAIRQRVAQPCSDAKIDFCLLRSWRVIGDIAVVASHSIIHVCVHILYSSLHILSEHVDNTIA